MGVNSLTIFCTLAGARGPLVQVGNVVPLFLCPATVGVNEGEQWVVWSVYVDILVLLHCPSVK